MSVRELRRDELFDWMVANPNGGTIDEIGTDLGYNHREVRGAIFDLRNFLGEYDTINLPCDPSPIHRGQWVYKLVGTLDEVRSWSSNRVRDAETRIRTMQSMLSSIVRATKGNTTAGKKARLMETGLRHLVEDLDNLILTADL